MPDDGAMKIIQEEHEFVLRQSEHGSRHPKYRSPMGDNNFYGDNPDEDDYFEG